MGARWRRTHVVPVLLRQGFLAAGLLTAGGERGARSSPWRGFDVQQPTVVAATIAPGPQRSGDHAPRTCGPWTVALRLRPREETGLLRQIH
jgi:hypothetical protein